MKMKKKTRNRLIALGVVLVIALLVVLGYRFVLNNMLIPSDQVIKCAQKSEWSDTINASVFTYEIENEYCKTVQMNGGDVQGYCLPADQYGLICFGTANVYVYEALTFDGKTDYYQTWIINFYTGSEVIQKTTYTSPTEFTSEYVENYVTIDNPDNLVIVNGSVEFYRDPNG